MGEFFDVKPSGSLAPPVALAFVLDDSTKYAHSGSLDEASLVAWLGLGLELGLGLGSGLAHPNPDPDPSPSLSPNPKPNPKPNPNPNPKPNPKQASLVAFVRSVQSGSATPHYRSQPVPTASGPVLELVGSTYAAAIADPDKVSYP